MKSLVDQSGRHIHKLRLGLLDACNFRCLYCMPDNPVFMPKKNWMKREERRKQNWISNLQKQIL